MNLLLLKEITDSEKFLVSDEIFMMAKLARANLAPNGVVIWPGFEDLAEAKNLTTKEKNFYYQNQNFKDFAKVWGLILKVWDKGRELGKNLSPQVVLFTKVDETWPGFVGPENEEIIEKAQRLLYFPHKFLISKQKIIKVIPYIKESGIISHELGERDVKVKILGTTVKLFAPINFTKEVFSYYYQKDSLFILDEDLIKIANLNTANPVIIFLPEVEVDGALGARALLLRIDYLKKFVEGFLFLRNKKGLLHIHLGIPDVKSVFEFDWIKRELASLNISRKGTLKFWLTLATPENFLNLNSYLESGLDGVVINLDKLNQNLLGFNENEKGFYNHDLNILLEFLKPEVKTLHKLKIPILVRGKICSHPEVVRFIIDQGIFGVMTEDSEVSPEHLEWEEKRRMSARG